MCDEMIRTMTTTSAWKFSLMFIFNRHRWVYLSYVFYNTHRKPVGEVIISAIIMNRNLISDSYISHVPINYCLIHWFQFKNLSRVQFLRYDKKVSINSIYLTQYLLKFTIQLISKKNVFSNLFKNHL